MENLRTRPPEADQALTALPTHSSHMITLRQWEEVVAKCVGLSVEDENIIIRLRVNGQKTLISVPICQNTDISKAVAQKWVGNKIGILRTDDPLKTYAVRIIGEESNGNDHDGSNRRDRFLFRKALKR